MAIRRSTTSTKSRRDDDDDEYEAPKRSRRAARDEDPDDDEDDRPKRKRAARDDDDEDDDEPPRRKRKDVEEDDDEPAPRRKRAARDEEEDDEDDRPARKRRSRDDEDDDEAPRKGRGDTPSGKLKGGWNESKRQLDESSTFAQTLKPVPEPQVIKFMEDEPYVSFRRHWVERVNGKVKTNRPYTCPKSFGRKPDGKEWPCPVCDVGDRPQMISSFNVAVLDTDGGLSMKSFDVGAKLLKQINLHKENPKVAPLSKGYFVVQKPAGKNTDVVINPLKARDLDDYDLEEPDPRDLKALNLYDADIVEITPFKTLKEIAAEMADDD